METVADTLRRAADEYLSPDYWPEPGTKERYLCYAVQRAVGIAADGLDAEFSCDAIEWLRKCGTFMSGAGFLATCNPGTDFSEHDSYFNEDEMQQIRYCWANFCADLWEEEHANRC